MTRFALFCCYLALGVALGLLFAGVSALGRKLRVPPVTVVLDVVYAFVAVFSAAVLAYFFNDGILEIQNVAALLIGFGICFFVLEKSAASFGQDATDNPTAERDTPNPHRKNATKRPRRRKSHRRT